MVKVVGIRFENNTNVYYFKVDEMEVRKGETVVVESELGVSLGNVVRGNFEPDNPDVEYKPVLRRAGKEDFLKARENEGLKEEALRFFCERTMARGLPMKLVGVDATLDRKRLTFYFVAENRIDFRELVKDLASKFRTRIELRQIGVRDAARMAGGFGICGRELCCKTFLRTFAPISIKMAKHQGLVLNTCKLSGLCGRLMCCLNYENDEYARPDRRRTKKEAVEAEAPPLPAAAEEHKPEPAIAVAPVAGKVPEEGERKDGDGKKRRRSRRRRRRRSSKKPQTKQ
jgi:cell fate regulator YaaT (PSP1 superfamily)